MLNNRRLLDRDITYSAAKAYESNILHELGYYDQKTRYYNHLYKNRELVQEIVAHHLNLASTGACTIADPQNWRHGSFNLCIPVYVRGHPAAEKVIIRFPLPYRVGEKPYPGNADEKILCEAGTYAWLQENCPDVPIPELYGFGVSSGTRYTLCDNLPFFSRMFFYLRCQLRQWLGKPLPSRYVPRTSRKATPEPFSYLLMNFVEGNLLSDSWQTDRHDTTKRTNLFRGLSRIMLSAARIPLPRIGSFTIDSKGYLSLTNRPLTLEIHDLENQKIPVDIPRTLTYITTDTYIHDMLSFHENRLRHQPNAIHDFEDCLYQMSALTVMRTIYPSFFSKDLRAGPFHLSLTDLHRSNIFVDEDWNVTSLIDLEWACARPIELIHPPYWLSDQPVNDIDQNDYPNLHEEFLSILAEEEAALSRHRASSEGDGTSQQLLHPIMRRGWENGTFWYALALDSPMGLFKVFYDYIQPRFAEEHLDDPAFFRIIMAYWEVGAMNFVQTKMVDRDRYEKRLRKAFQI